MTERRSKRVIHYCDKCGNPPKSEKVGGFRLINYKCPCGGRIIVEYNSDGKSKEGR